MEKQVLDILEQYTKKRVEMKYIVGELKNVGINLIADPSLSRPFIDVIQKLIDENVLIPLKSAKRLQQYEGLPNKYEIDGCRFRQCGEEMPAEELRGLSRKLDMSYYLKHVDEYREHRKIIRRINDLLMQGDCEVLTANERSYLIFGDEKAITAPKDASIDGETILNRLNLTIEDIKAEKKPEPFFYIKAEEYESLRNVSARTILIVENKDTFWTFMDATLSRKLADVHLLIYGEGNAVMSKFEFIHAVGGKTTDNYYYFGDMDQEGIIIFNRLRNTFPEYEIRPAVSLYEYMLDKAGPENAKPLRKYRKLNGESLSLFIDFFSQDTGKLIKEIISAQKYIPQEVINKTDMERLGKLGLR